MPSTAPKGNAVRSVRLKLDGETVATARAGASFPRPVVLRHTIGRRLVVEALGADGGVLASAAAFVNATPPPPAPTLRLAGSAAAGEALAELLKAAQAGDAASTSSAAAPAWASPTPRAASSTRA